METTNQTPTANQREVVTIDGPPEMTAMEKRIYRTMGQSERLMMKALRQSRPVIYHNLIQSDRLVPTIEAMARQLERETLIARRKLEWTIPPQSMATMDRIRQGEQIQLTIEETQPDRIEAILEQTTRGLADSTPTS